MLTNQYDIIECDIIEGQICGFGIAAESSVGMSDVRSSILELLRPLGITERYFGVRQLIQAVEMVNENPDTIHALQKEVFSEIAAQYRNMAEELFGGHIASQITLKDALVSGLLPMPSYKSGACSNLSVKRYSGL